MITLKNKWSALTLCLLLMALVPIAGNAQTGFEQTQVLEDDFFRIIKIKMADYNNDGLMDLLFQSQDSSGEQSITLLLKQDSLSWEQALVIYQDSLNIYDWLITDINNNNQVDIVIGSQSPTEGAAIIRTIYNSADTLAVSDFQLDNISEAMSIFSADFDQNGWRDLAVSTASLDIFYQDNGQFINYTLDSISQDSLKMFVGDYNNDTYKDFLISGKDSVGMYSGFWSNIDNTFIQNTYKRLPYALLTNEMDINADGKPDYAIYTDSSQVQLYYNHLDSMDRFTSWNIAGVKDLFLADFNADGRTDLFVGAETSRIFFQNSDSVFAEQILELPQYTSITFGHLDTDGNLDLILSHRDSLDNEKILFYTNTTQIENVGPSPVFMSAGIYINGDLRLFWESSSDDFTESESLTYDVLVQGKVQSDFDWVNYKRLLLNKGNAGYAHEYLVKNVNPGQTDYIIQSIDNSFQTNQLVCSGGVVICQASDYNFQYLCAPNLIEFNFPETRAWYSASKGFLGFSNEFSQYFADNDTLYSVLPFSLSCHNQQAWVIQLAPELNISTSGDSSICLGGYFEYQLDSSVWETAQWKNTDGSLSDSLYIYYQATENDTLFLEATNHLGCSAFDTLVLNVTPLEINLWQDTIVCLPSTLVFELPQIDWQSALWTNQDADTLSTELILSLTPTEPETIYIKALSTQGCIALDTIQVEVEEIIAGVTNQNITIYKGEMANLQANGGLYYEWFPSINLDNPDVANTQSSTLESMVYQVAVTGALGCADTVQVNVTVLNRAFVANLFSPNSDGSNDSWRILELEGVSQFKLVIVDREGQIMYETKQEYEAANLGWDGTKNGTPQPAGVYFWKVSGRYVEGNEITLNGAKEGQILLMR